MSMAEHNSQVSDPSQCLGNRRTAQLSTVNPENETVSYLVEIVAAMGK